MKYEISEPEETTTVYSIHYSLEDIFHLRTILSVEYNRIINAPSDGSQETEDLRRKNLAKVGRLYSATYGSMGDEANALHPEAQQ